MTPDDTIYALSSASGRAGVAVIRISGSAAKDILRAMCKGSLEPRRAYLKSIIHPDSKDVLDQALVLWFAAPNSFTGEDVAELHVHGGPAVISAVMEAISQFTYTRMAEAGEFTRRAFYNNKLDLTKIEAISDLVDAETESQRKQALRQMQGGLSELLNGWRKQLIHILAYVEAGIDFSDEEDVDEEVNRHMLSNIAALRIDIAEHLDDGKSGERLRSGLQVVIAGPPNAGKSSLMNILAKRDVAIVSEQAGTTRDIIEVHLDLNGFAVTLSDTAGLRVIKDSIEEEGVRRARGKIENADVILWLTDGSKEENAYDFTIDSEQTLIRLRNKSDIDSCRTDLETGKSAVYRISAKTSYGLDILIQVLSDIAGDLQVSGENAVITRARHREALSRVVEVLTKILEAPDQADELIAENLRISARELGRVTGSVDVEDLLDVIFSDFCIGK